METASEGGASTAKSLQFRAGLELRRDMFGEAAADSALAPGFKAPLEEIVTSFCFGTIWQRPALDRKTRSLLTVALLSVLAKPAQLKAHIRGAIANGVTADEIRETMLHVMLYGGLPAAADSTNHAAEALAEMGLA